MPTKTYNQTEFNNQDLDKFAKLGANYFTRPPKMKNKDFIKKIKEELLQGAIQVRIREISLKRKFL